MKVIFMELSLKKYWKIEDKKYGGDCELFRSGRELPNDSELSFTLNLMEKIELKKLKPTDKFVLCIKYESKLVVLEDFKIAMSL